MRRGVGANAIALMVFAFLPVFLGLAARALFPGIEARDQVLPTLLLHGLPVWLGALALAAVFSAEVGACEAILFMLSTSLSQDLYKRIVNPAATPEQVLRVARIAAFVGGSAGMLLAVFVVKEIIDALSVFYSIVGATLLVPVVGGLFVQGATQPRCAGRDRGGHDRVPRGAVRHRSDRLAQSESVGTRRVGDRFLRVADDQSGVDSRYLMRPFAALIARLVTCSVISIRRR